VGLEWGPFSLGSTIDRLCGLLVRVPGYRYRGPGSIPGATDFLRSSGSGTGFTHWKLLLCYTRHSVNSSSVFTRLSGPRSRPTTSQENLAEF
jgi:hypothetical protein